MSGLNRVVARDPVLDGAAVSDRESLIAFVRGGGQPRYLFFWGHTPPVTAAGTGAVGKHCLSQWWAASFIVQETTYPTAEHFMMAEKARLFGDRDAAARILAAPGPSTAKKVGRTVSGFDQARWKTARFDIVVRGNVAKFGQSPALLAYMLGTGGRVLVEASPADRVWGIGLRAEDARAQDPQQWRGRNLLGFALMEARRRLREVTPAGA